MDPNATLAEIRSLIVLTTDALLETGNSLRLAELIESLDSWLSKGGFLPENWRHAQQETVGAYARRISGGRDDGNYTRTS